MRVYVRSSQKEDDLGDLVRERQCTSGQIEADLVNQVK